MKQYGLMVGMLMLAGSVLAQTPYLAVNGANHDYLTLNYYVNEPTDSEMVFLDLYPNEANVEQAQIWSNLGRRDRATLGDQDFTSVPGPGPGSTNYFVGYPMTNAGGGKWVVAIPANKTGAYRLTGRYKVAGNPAWKWVGGRDTAVMVSPKKARDVILYETQVNVINATGNTEASRSTFEDMMNPAKPANLDYFQDLGINTLWIQPIHPIGDHYCVSKTGGPGSPYSIQNMWEVAPHHSIGNTRASSMAAFTNFAAAAKAKGIDFFFDIIFNHTSWDAEIGRDPANPELPAANPLAKIKDILPQWYSRYNSTDLPCGEYAYTQGNFAFQLPAQNASQIGPAPAERNDFGKWPDVADLFWGTYPALLNPQTDTDAYWDVTQTGNDVKRMVEYFAYFGKYWIEKSGGTLGGFRCDYAQGLPPQAWEYFVNKVRQTKWDFIFMAESLDGGNVSKRAGRHMDIINQNWVWQVLENAGNTTGFRGIIDANKTAYGYAGIMRGLINHDQNAPADVWYSFSRYAVGAVIDGTPQIYQGQELGYRNNYGFSIFRNQFDRFIPDIFKWHNMQTLWNNRIGILEDAYKRVNKGRMLNIATRLHDQWYLDQQNGSPHQEIFSVLKYEKFGWDPAHQNVVLNFVNLTPWTQRQGTFKLNGVNAIFLNPTRFYNVRNLTANNPNLQLWPAPGRTGQDIISNGIFIDMPADGNANPDKAFVQMLKLEEHGGGGPVDPYVSINPTNPVGCGTVAIRYRKADSPLGAGPVFIHIGRNGFQDVLLPNPQMANDGSNWVYFVNNMLPGTTNLNFVFNNGSGNWDNNSGQDWSVTVTGCTGTVPQAVWTVPETVQNCEPVTIYYNAAGRVLASANPVYIHIGRNGWTNMITPTPAMTLVSNAVWMYTYTPTTGTETINFVFNDGNTNQAQRIWDNNSGNDWSKSVSGCGSIVPPPAFAITTPGMDVLSVANNIANYTVQGDALNMTGHLRWTNTLTGASGVIAATHPWSIPLIALSVGSNVITVSGSNTVGGSIVTNAQDNAANYGSSWTNNSNQGTGFNAWTLESGGTAGHFIGDKGFGMWSHEGGNFAAAIRPFTAALAVGQTFHARIQNNWIWENGGSVGMALRDAAGVTKWELYFVGGSNVYNGTNPTDINWTSNGVDVAFTLTGATSYSVDVTPVGGAKRTYTGSISGTINQFRSWSANNGTGDAFNPNRDFFFNSLKLTSLGGGSGSITSDTVTIVRQGQALLDSNGDGVPDAWYVQYGKDPMIPNLAGQMGSNGMMYGESYAAGLDPNDPDDFFGMNRIMASSNTVGRSAMQWHAKPQRSYRVWASRTGVEGPYTNEVATRTTVGASAYNMVIEDSASTMYPESYYMLELIESGSGGGGGGGGGSDPVIVSAAPGSTTFTNIGGIAVTLSVSGGTVTNAIYTIQGQSAVPFTNNQVIVIGGDFTNGQAKTLTLFAQNSANLSDQKVYTYTRATGIAITNAVRFKHFPENGSITTNTEIWVDAYSQPVGAGVSADIIFCAGSCTGSWPLVAMSRNPGFDTAESEYWNVNLGTFPAGTVIQYALVVRDAQGTEIWDSNGGANYTATVNGGGGGGTGGSIPPSTNPTFGQFGTKTIDGANNGEWTTNNLIALDLANDDPRSLGENWTMHETSADLTHLWAAWDDNNLYLAWQCVDMTDQIDGSNWQSGDPLGNNSGYLFFISLDTGTGGSTSNMWDKNDSFSGPALPDYQIGTRSDLWAGGQYISQVVTGKYANDVNYHTNLYGSAASRGIQLAKGNILASPTLWGVADVDHFLSNPNTPRVNYSGHNTSRDYFYEMSVPLSAIGLTKAMLEANGIGVFISLGSTSALDTIPHDGATLNTPGTKPGDNSSWEWGDYDVFTSPFARVVK